jgi:hypothetical protein
MQAATAEKATPSPRMFDVCKRACRSEYENSYFPNMFFFFVLFYRFVRKPLLLVPMSMLI